MHRNLPALITGVLCLAILAGSAIAQAQGTAQEVYLAYHNALKSSLTMEGVWPFYSRDHQAEVSRIYPAGIRDKAFFLIKAASPARVRVVTERDEGDRVTLGLRATNAGESFDGTAVLVREGGGWKIDDVTWRRH